MLARKHGGEDGGLEGDEGNIVGEKRRVFFVFWRRSERLIPPQLVLSTSKEPILHFGGFTFPSKLLFCACKRSQTVQCQNESSSPVTYLRHHVRAAN